MPDDLLTASDVADLFNVHENTVYRWVQKGELAAIRMPGGKLIRFKRADVLALLEPAPQPETAA